MPRYVDADQRRADILRAAAVALSEEGYGRMTLRSLAKRMGGSSTLVTHYYSTKDLLVAALVDQILAEAEKSRDELLAIENHGQRVRRLLDYFLPNDERTLRDERVRVALLPYKQAEPAIGQLFDVMEPSMRALIRAGLEDAVASDDLEEYVDVVRAWASGVALSTVEHPEIWTPDHQAAVTDRFLSLLPLKRSRRTTPAAGRRGSAPTTARKAADLGSATGKRASKGAGTAKAKVAKKASPAGRQSS